MMGLSNCMMEPSNPLKKIIKFTSLSRTALRRKLVKSCLKSLVFSEVAYSQDRRWFRQQDARHTENKAGRDGLSVGTISHFLAPAGILQVGFGFSIFQFFNLKNGPQFRFSTTQISYAMIRVSWVWTLDLISNIFYRRIWKLYNPCHISMYRCLSFAWHQRRS